MILRLRFGLFALVFVLWSVLFFLLTAMGELLRPGFIGWTAQRWSAGFRVQARLLLGIRLRLVGEVPDAPVIIAPKHQSPYETLALLDILRNPAVVLKAELLAVPFWRWFARANGAMPIDREASSTAVRQLLRGAKAACAAGRAILIFPEGTRVPPGEAPPVLPGTSALYGLLKLPVAPVALDSGAVWPLAGVPRPGTVTVRFLPVIPAGLPRETFEARLHAAINEAP